MADKGSIFWLIWACSVVGAAIANMVETSIQLNQYITSFHGTPFCKSSGLSETIAEETKGKLNRISGISTFCGVCFIIQSFFSGIIPIYFHAQKNEEYERTVSIFGFLLEVLWMTAALPIYAIEFSKEASGSTCMETLTDLSTYSVVAYIFWICLAILIPAIAFAKCIGIASFTTDEQDPEVDSDADYESGAKDCRSVVRRIVVGIVIMALMTYSYIAVLYLMTIYDPGVAIAFTHFAITCFNATVLKCGCIINNFGNFRMPWQIISEKVAPMDPKEVIAAAGAVLEYVPEPESDNDKAQPSSSRKSLKKKGGQSNSGQKEFKTNANNAADKKSKGGSRVKSEPAHKFIIQRNNHIFTPLTHSLANVYGLNLLKCVCMYLSLQVYCSCINEALGV
eukprot:TRINITY_DN89877_c0_g1_i1.p1 TRINITY_DN89877_c0_g1~~TRINITY_DN89877_c0_g1_i1.p1  ORF type:complete len:395 (-),score=22.80 TRINITY_DN89877_c0_g1_i1:46-1230(-)